VREHVERLQACGLREVCRVGMSGEREVRVRSICLGEVGDKVIEATVVGVADWSDALEEGVGRLGCLGRACNEAEPVCVLSH